VRESTVKALILFVAWCVLLALSWPIAITVLVLAPIAWLIALPFRLAGLVIHAAFAFLAALLFLPARLLGYRPGH
jgi:uncharacterized membrane protein YhhN